MPNMPSGIIDQFVTFFRRFCLSATGVKIVPVSVVIITFLIFLGATVKFFLSFKKWFADQPHSNLVFGLGEFVKEGFGVGLVWMFAGAMPIMLMVLGGTIQGRLIGLPTSIGKAAGPLVDSVYNGIRVMWFSQGELQDKLAEESPVLFDGLRDDDATAADAAAAADAARKLKAVAATDIAAMKKQAATLQSSDPAAANRLLAQAKKTETDVNNGFTSIDAQQKASASQAAAGPRQSPTIAGASGPTESSWRIFSGVLTLGVSEFFLLIKRCLAGSYSFISILIPLLFAVMALWRIIQAVIGALSYLTSYIVMTVVGCTIGQALGPLAMLSFLTQDWRRYGHSFVSWWLQAFFGGYALSIGAGIACTGFASLAGMAATTALSTYTTTVIGADSIGDRICGGAMTGLGYMAVSFGADFFTKALEKFPYAGIGLISGTFHP